LKNKTRSTVNLINPTNIMKKSNSISQILALTLCVCALPLLGVINGCAGDRYHQSTGESVDDSGISMRVKSALADDTQYTDDGVEVKTFKGTVQLSGFVDSSAQMSRAGKLAKGVEGVKSVENNITVKP
jgi:hyperosmotically inducible protein